MDDLPNQEKKKNIYKKHWEGVSPENAFISLDLHRERMCMACKSGCIQKQKADKRLDGKTKKYQGPPPGYVFDR
jgi:hypothetical protein